MVSTTRSSSAGTSEELLALFAEGRLRPHIGARFPLTDAAAALRYVADRRALGKVVIDVRLPPLTSRSRAGGNAIESAFGKACQSAHPEPGWAVGRWESGLGPFAIMGLQKLLSFSTPR